MLYSNFETVNNWFLVDVSSEKWLTKEAAKSSLEFKNIRLFGNVHDQFIQSDCITEINTKKNLIATKTNAYMLGTPDPMYKGFLEAIDRNVLIVYKVYSMGTLYNDQKIFSFSCKKYLDNRSFFFDVLYIDIPKNNIPDGFTRISNGDFIFVITSFI